MTVIACGPPMTSVGDHSSKVASFKSRVDVDHRNVGCTTIQHTKQCGKSMKTRAVAHTRRHPDDWAVQVPAYDTWQRPFHTGYYHSGIEIVQSIQVRW